MKYKMTPKGIKICIGIVSLILFILVLVIAINAGNNEVETIEIVSDDIQEFIPGNVTDNCIETGDNDKNREEDKSPDKKQDVNSGKNKRPKGISDNIRVLISDKTHGYVQPYVELSCNTEYTVNDGKELVIHRKDDIITIDSETLKEGTLIIAPNSEEGRITISSIIKSGGVPSYRGTIKIAACDEGYTVVNSLPVEEYLYGVVASEVPATFEEEALKTQAVCARGFAYNRICNPAFLEYGADLDDSTSSQVYNNFPETDSSIDAVNDTYGIVPMYNNDFITALYFSTSCGVTCSNVDVWGGEALDYLGEYYQKEQDDEVYLADETAFRSFIDDNMINKQKCTDMYEAELPFYRWTAVYSYEEMTNAIANGIVTCDADKVFILKNGKYVAMGEECPDIGEVTSIRVEQRGTSGIVKELIVVGSNNTIKCVGQHNIRRLLRPFDITITCRDGSEKTGYEMLPSAFFYVQRDEGIGQFVIKGGGFGHGSGMSQNGANEMAKLGYNYKEIINHYYRNVELVQIK